MGVDWFRVRPKASSDPAELRSLIGRQAVAFQSITKFWIDCPLELPADRLDREKKTWIDEYLLSSKLLAEQFEMPPYDEDKGCCSDIPDLEPCRRTACILDNPIFPPPWAKEGNRSFLPGELLEQVSVWQNWIREVACGKHREYLLQLWAYRESMMLYHHWQTLQEMAQKTVGRTNQWAQKPSLLKARDEVEKCAAPAIHPAPVSIEWDYAWSETLQSEILRTTSELVSLTRRWDSCVKDSYKVRYYQRFYRSLDEWIEEGTGTSYTEGLEWAARCGSLGFGLYLDY